MQTTRLTFHQYPKLMQEMFDPPKSLDLAGAPIPSDEHKFLCVIGARRYSEYGEQACRELIKGLRGYPVVIVSGLALGIDSIAHDVAIEAGLKTIAFPGSGLCRRVIYPRSHLHIAERILKAGGTLLSPFPYMQEGAPWTFPVRNRLMAGISHATLVIEGRVGSGTLLTAGYALEFNRDVFIVPGSIFSELSYGPHTLYKAGATPVATSKDVLHALGFELPEDIEPMQMSLTDPRLSLTDGELLIIEKLKFSPLTSSKLIEKTGLPASEVNIILSELELRDLVKQDGDIYRMKRRW